MDKQLLKALDNLSKSLEMIAESLSKKDGEGSKSDVTKALQGGNFIEQIKEINVSVKQIRKDTQEILRQQKTIMDMQKKSSGDKKTEAVETDPKKESSIKKGVGAILLIAVAVLAIGMAFKIVGKVDFISVIGLGLAIVLISIAFEKVAKLNITPKQAVSTSLAMVIMAGAVLISSFLLSKVAVLTMGQVMSITFIGLAFYFLAPVMANMIKSMTTNKKIKTPDGKTIETSGIEWGTLIKSIIAVPLIMVGMSLGIMLSSKILANVTVISIPQALVSILIAGVFSLAAGGIVKILTVLTKNKISVMEALKAAIALPLIMLGMAAGIWLSSFVLSKVIPIGFPQALTSILIAAVFSVAAFGIKKILRAFKGLDPGSAIKATLLMPLIFPALSIAIWLSSMVLNKVQPLGLPAFLGAVMISVLFVILSFGMKNIAKAMKKMDWADIPKLPVFFLLISIAIAASAFIFFKSKEYFQIEWMTMLKILALGVVVGILGIVFGFATKIIGNIAWGLVFKLPIFFTLISMAVAASAVIFFTTQQYFQIPLVTLLKMLIFGVIIGILGIVFGFATKIIGNISWSAVIKLPIFFTLISLAVALSAVILSFAAQKIDNMSLMLLLKILIFGVVLAITAVVLAIAIKILNTLGGPVAYLKGALVLVILAATIMVSSLILNVGKYEKYPTLGWIIGVGLSLTTFGIAAFVLGAAVFGPQALIFLAGLAAVLAVAGTIVATSLILEKGKYDVKGLLLWSLSMAVLFGTFTPIIIALGAMGLAGAVLSFFGAEDPFEKAKKMMIQIAETIVAVGGIISKGKFEGGPTVEWATGIAITLAAFSPLYMMLMANGVMKLFGGGGVGPEDFANAITTVSTGIVKAGEMFAKSKDIWKGAPTKEWAEGVKLALEAFSPLYSMLLLNGVLKLFGGGGVGPKEFSEAIVTVSTGILTAAEKFASPENKGVWKGGPTKEWAEGVGIAIGAFSPVLKILSDGAIISLFGGKGVDAAAMKGAIISISEGIVEAAKFFGNPENKLAFTENYPKKEWGEGVGMALSAFAPVFTALQGKGWFTTGDEVIKEMKMGILAIADAIVGVARVLSGPDGKKPDWTSYPTKEWGEGIKSAVENFMGILESVKQFEGGIAVFSTQATLITLVMSSVAMAAIMLAKANQVGGFKKEAIPSKEWMEALTFSAITYARLTNRLLAMLTTEEKKTITDSGFFSSTTTEVKEKKAKDISIVNRVVNQMIGTGILLFLARRVFQNKIDPNYMKNVASNVLAFADLAKRLGLVMGGGGVTGMLKGLVGADPVSRMAEGMIKIAGAYDILARALQRFSGAINSMDAEKITLIRKLTGNLAVLSSMDADMFSRMMSVLESKASVFSKLVDADRSSGATVGGKKAGGGEGGGAKSQSSQSPTVVASGPSKDMSKQLDEVIKVLKDIRFNTSGLDDYLESLGFSAEAASKL